MCLLNWRCPVGLRHRQRSLTVVSKGTPFTQQSYKVADAFPYEWVKKKVGRNRSVLNDIHFPGQ